MEVLVIHPPDPRAPATNEITGFDEIGYKYELPLSGGEGPTFVAKTFEGMGVSIR